MNFLKLSKKSYLTLLFFSIIFAFNLNTAKGQSPDIGVIFALHGGMNTYHPQYLWDSSVQMFSYDPNHPVYKFVIWNSAMWGGVLQAEFGQKFIRKYDVEYERIGGTDPFHILSDIQLADMKAELDNNPYGLSFEVDWVGWMAGDNPDHYAYPHFIYYGPDGGDHVTYCGEEDPGGPWEGCDPNRHDVDSPVERLLKKGVSRIIMVDLAVGGVRFYKAFDPLQMTKRRLDEWNTGHGTSIPIIWVNDYSNLMERSYPTEPEGWTPTLGEPTYDPKVLLNGNPNPIASDPELALLHVEGIEASMSETVSDAETGVILFNHGLFYDEGGLFDPKIDDTIILNENIKSQLLDRHPEMDADNIVGAYWGVKELNTENGLVELSREQRGEHLGGAQLYESDQEMPGDEWGYRCWDALEYLKNRGVKHIVIGFPQVITDSVLTYVEIPNQIGKEIGIKTWAKWGTWDYETYPEVGHPFIDYWGPWVDTDCGEWDLNYDNGTSEFTPGATLTGQTSGARGVIKWFSGDVAAGILILKEVEGTFQDNEAITDDKGGSALADGTTSMTSKTECCFTMGGCGDPLRPYPPPRQTPINQKMSDMDPSLAFDLSDYGHLGYDPATGAPDPNVPVHDQYTGTWEMYIPPSDDPRVGQLLAKHVLNAAVKPMVYITNGNLEAIKMGESVTFEAHVTGGVPGYTYEWSIKEEGDPDWSTVGGNSSTWQWNPGSKDVGTYAVRCKVTDSQTRTGEVIWEGFIILEEQPCLSEEIYGEDSEEAEILRYMRDNILSHTPEGQEIIRLYYELSPAIVKAMSEDEQLKEEVKKMIDGILPLIEEVVR